MSFFNFYTQHFNSIKNQLNYFDDFLKVVEPYDSSICYQYDSSEGLEPVWVLNLDNILD